MDESEIVKLYFLRDEKALSETREKYGSLIKGLVYGILRCEQDSEECVSDVYFRLWRSIPPAKPDSLKAYALKIARNEALMKLRGKKAGKRGFGADVPLSELEDILPDKNIPDGSEGWIKELISGFVGELSQDARLIFIRRYWFFDSVEEIASRYGFGRSKVKSSLRASRERLRKRLKEEGVVL